MKATTNLITYEEACEAYYTWAKEQPGDPQQPSVSLSEEHYGIWHLENINGPLVAVTDDKEVVPVADFYAAYERLAEEGECDGAGGMEYRRVLAEWIEERTDNLDEFIIRRANISPWDIDSESPAREASVKPSTKKLKVTLFGEEVVMISTEAIVEVPLDATKDEIEEVGGRKLEALMWETKEYVEWKLGDVDSRLTFDDVCIEACPEADQPSLRLVRNDAGELVLAE